MTGGRMVGVLGALLLVVPATLTGQGQDRDPGLSVRFGVASEVRTGRPAPDLVLPYATADGRGPADQPFNLRKELGRVVVLVFQSRLDSTETSVWREVAALVPAGTVMAGVIPAVSFDSVVTFAAGSGIAAKFLEDAGGKAALSWGADSPGKTALLVIGRDGVIRYHDRDYRAGSSNGSKFAAALEAAREGGR